MQYSNPKVIHTPFKIDAECLHMAHWHSFLQNYSGVAVKGTFKDQYDFLSGELETYSASGVNVNH